VTKFKFRVEVEIEVAMADHGERDDVLGEIASWTGNEQEESARAWAQAEADVIGSLLTAEEHVEIKVGDLKLVSTVNEP